MIDDVDMALSVTIESTFATGEDNCKNKNNNKSQNL